MLRIFFQPEFPILLLGPMSKIWQCDIWRPTFISIMSPSFSAFLWKCDFRCNKSCARNDEHVKRDSISISSLNSQAIRCDEHVIWYINNVETLFQIDYQAILFSNLGPIMHFSSAPLLGGRVRKKKCQKLLKRAFTWNTRLFAIASTSIHSAERRVTFECECHCHTGC